MKPRREPAARTSIALAFALKGSRTRRHTKSRPSPPWVWIGSSNTKARVWWICLLRSTCLDRGWGALAAKEARLAVVEKQRLELRHELEAAQQEASVASARREEVEAQQRESEREVRALREAAALAESSFAEWLESMRARLALQQASSVDELAVENAGCSV
jgi:hypothetical protein